MAAWFERWLEAEREALILRYWQPIIVPGLFQTADYARALLLTAQADTSDEAIDALVAVRLERRPSSTGRTRRTSWRSLTNWCCTV